MGVGSQNVLYMHAYYWVGSHSVVQDNAGFLILNGVFLLLSVCCTRAIGIALLMSQFGTCSVGISGDRQTSTQEHRQVR